MFVEEHRGRCNHAALAAFERTCQLYLSRGANSPNSANSPKHIEKKMKSSPVEAVNIQTLATLVCRT